MADEPEKKPDKTFLQKVGGGIVDFGEWLLEKLILDPHQRALNALVDDLGVTLDKVPKFPTDLSLTQIKAYVQDPNPGLEAWVGAIVDINKLIESVRAIIDAVKLDDAGATSDELLQSAIDLLASNYVRDRYFHLYTWMEFTRFSTEPMTLYGPQGTASKRFYGSLKALLKFALAPIGALCEHADGDGSRRAQVVGSDAAASRRRIRVHGPFGARDRTRRRARGRAPPADVLRLGYADRRVERGADRRADRRRHLGAHDLRAGAHAAEAVPE